MSFLSRRDFIKDSAVLAALAAAGVGGKAMAGAKSEKDTKSGDAASQLRVAVVGVHGRGQEHVRGFAGKNNCIVTTICDADSDVIGRAMKHAEKAQGQAPKYEQDIRKVVEDKNIDIISIATPNHWHSLAAIWGLQNGKDVYVEKPVSHNVSEGRRIVEAARKTNQHLPGRHAEPQQHRPQRGDAVRPRRQARQSHRRPRPVLQAARQHRQGERPAAAAQDGGLRSVVRAGPDGPGDAQAVPLRLALVLGLRQRRPRQPGHPRDGHGPLGPRQDRVGRRASSASAAASATSTTARRPTRRSASSTTATAS